ncbi:MAG: hypothetical protein NT069_32215 [Planctomycetota bacterium]|nr:hypothetical protein [Planctomycetota bacterium]
MIKDALEFLATLGSRATGAKNRAEILEHPKDPTLHWLVTATGTERLPRTIPDRSHRLYSIADFRTVLSRLSLVTFEDKAETTEQTFGTGSVWVWGDLSATVTGAANATVTAVFDDRPGSARNDRATCVVRTTPEFELLRLMAVSTLDQKSMRDKLRVDLAECSVPQPLIDWVSKIDWSTGSRTTRELAAGRESLGADIQAAAISTAGVMPEQITLMVRIFNDPQLLERTPIPCVFDADAKAQTLSLRPVGNSLRMAYDAALAQIRDNLMLDLRDLVAGDEGIPVYLGNP